MSVISLTPSSTCGAFGGVTMPSSGLGESSSAAAGSSPVALGMDAFTGEEGAFSGGFGAVPSVGLDSVPQ